MTLLVASGVLFGLMVGWALADSLLARGERNIADEAITEHEASLREAEERFFRDSYREYLEHCSICGWCRVLGVFTYYPMTAALTKEQLAEIAADAGMDFELEKIQTAGGGSAS
ncbi:MAG: hypothetical protein QM638_01080 [Nocardioides sp.]|uniref:hypothetical protein n=1 Tax=Nocardioides sp. TaxID=35761 RepID=UPI0039E4B89A